METKRVANAIAENCEPFIHLENHRMNRPPLSKVFLKMYNLTSNWCAQLFEAGLKVSEYVKYELCVSLLVIQWLTSAHSSTQRHVHHLFWVTAHCVVGFCSPGCPHCLQATLLLTCLPTKPLCSSGALWQSTGESRDAATDCLCGISAVLSACYSSRSCETATNKIIIKPVLKMTQHLSKCNRYPSNVIILRLI